MEKGTIICTIEDKTFYYGGYNMHGWHLVYTEDENFHVDIDKNTLPTEKDCQRIYHNYYTQKREVICMKQMIKEIEPSITLHRDDKSGISQIVNSKTGLSHSVHANIDVTGSVTGMKKLGYWKKDARTVRCNGFIYNIDTFVCDDELDKIVAEECRCVACLERRKENGT